MLTSLTGFFGSIQGMLVGFGSLLVAVAGLVRVYITLYKVRAKSEHERAEAANAALREKQDYERHIAQEQTKLERHLLGALEIERGYSKTLMAQRDAADQQHAECTRRLSSLETDGRRKDDLISANSQIILRLDTQLQNFIKDHADRARVAAG